MFHTAIIFIKPDSSHAFKTVESILENIKNTSITAKIAASDENKSFFETKFPAIESILFQDIQEEGTIALSVGGDGTFLFTAKQVATTNIPIIGINQGNRGFLAPFVSTDVPSIINNVVNDNLTLQQIPLWQAEVEGKKDRILFINEFILQRHSSATMVRYTLNIDGMGAMDGRADGIIIASSTGSSAYNLTAGGNIIHPDLQVLSLTPICPHNLKHKPIIVPACKVTLTLNNDNAGINYDGFSAGTLDQGKSIRISLSEHKILFTIPEDLEYLVHLNNKIF